jgi:hypothetical protein
MQLGEAPGGSVAESSGGKFRWEVPAGGPVWKLGCLEAGLALGPNQCYGYKVPPFLGGGYTVGNFAAVDLIENYAFLADLWQQTKDLPDGTRVNLVVKRNSPDPR